MAILSTLFGFITINLLNARHATSLNTALDTITSDLQTQQFKAISQDTQGQENIDDYGVLFESNRYILFHGSSYSAADPSNVPIDLDDSLLLSTTFPNGIIVFKRSFGEILNFANGSNTVTIVNTTDNFNKTIKFNSLGVITDVN